MNGPNRYDSQHCPLLLDNFRSSFIFFFFNYQLMTFFYDISSLSSLLQSIRLSLSLFHCGARLHIRQLTPSLSTMRALLRTSVWWYFGTGIIASSVGWLGNFNFKVAFNPQPGLQAAVQHGWLISSLHTYSFVLAARRNLWLLLSFYITFFVAATRLHAQFSYCCY